MKLFAALLPIYFFISCTTSFQDRQIKNIPGEWEVYSITTLNADFSENGFDPLEPATEETGDLGFFEFTQSSVNYSFVRKDSLYSGNGIYSIDLNKTSTKIIYSISEDILLLPPDERPHDLIFNSENGEVIMLLTSYPQTAGVGESYTLYLRKVK
ncbi:MAG: hypothetical protein R3283_02865 [Balneolaceae bacterium]|nr:hypothetical protein [Balneolaceae bacterium]